MTFYLPRTTLLVLCILSVTRIFAQRDDSLNTIPANEKWSYHFQFTGIMQGHPDFVAAYSGQNSLSNKSEQAFSVTSTLFLGRKLWKGASLFVNPEVAGGKGISSALGIAGFTNGECFRIGNPAPTLYLARMFIRQHISLNRKSDNDTASADPNQLNGEKIPTKRITITAGKFALADMYDNNSCSHDPRTHFMNWALMSNGAWDYPANTRGYTLGLVVELVTPKYALRISETAVPKIANGEEFDPNVSEARGETIELEKKFKVKGKKCTLRLLAFRNLSRAVKYQTAISNLLNRTDTSMNVNSKTGYGGLKYGFGLNAETQATDNLSLFFRTSWNDGHSSTWAFTEIDQTMSIGLNLKGKKWKRPNDIIGVAGLVNNISNDHWDFLNYGGYGFMLGDGQLPHYGSEMITEVYYSAQLAKTLWFSADYQYVQNPGYNRDRGPVNVWALRAHVEF
jgi:high affinity Mn2+ porin